MRKLTPIFALLPLLFGGCGPSDGATPSPGETDPPDAEAPSITITSPVESGIYKVQREVVLQATVLDSDSALDTLIIEWTSSQEGSLATGNPSADGNFNATATFTVSGLHEITASVVDPTGASGQARTNISVSALEPPQITLNPAPEGVKEGETATITGVIVDAEDDADEIVIRWQVNDVSAEISSPDAFGNVSFETGPLDYGVVSIVAEATDTDGLVSEDRRDVVVSTCSDSDRDGYKVCGSEGDEIDCNDRDPDINPGEPEVCGEMGTLPVDEDCDGETDEGFEDTDRDGVPDCRDICPDDRQDDRDGDGICGDVDNCPGDPNPDQADADGDSVGDICDDEIAELCDGEDNDGDGYIDEGFDSDTDLDGVIDCLDPCPADPVDDEDFDGYCANIDNCPFDANSDQLDENGDGVGDACENEICDGKDNDSDGSIDEDFDQDGDGYPTCGIDGNRPDCDDTDPNAYPGPTEICGDGKDNDCDGYTDGVLDEYEPNNDINSVHSFGNRNDSEFRVNPTLFTGEDTGDSDWFQVLVVDDFVIGPDQFLFIAEISAIPEGIDVGLYLWYDEDSYLTEVCGEMEIIAATNNPGGRTQTLQHEGTSGPDDDVCPYIIEVRYLGGSLQDACEPYELWVFNEG